LQNWGRCRSKCRLLTSGPDGVKFLRADLDVTKTGVTRISTGDRLSADIERADIEIGRKIGQGVSGQVFLGRFRKHTLVAVKAICIYDKANRENLLNDLRTLATARHPSLIEFYGAYFNEGTVNLVMEYMDIGSLRSLLRPVRKLALQVPEVVIAHLSRSLLAGLDFLHSDKHQIHRDLKPENILLNAAGDVKISDFGISKELGRTQALTRTFIGTAAYMSPERVLNQEYSYPSDIWALGLLLEEIALG
jgi:mitogen-activated protein kinase kinase 3